MSERILLGIHPLGEGDTLDGCLTMRPRLALFLSLMRAPRCFGSCGATDAAPRTTTYGPSPAAACGAEMWRKSTHGLSFTLVKWTFSVLEHQCKLTFRGCRCVAPVGSVLLVVLSKLGADRIRSLFACGDRIRWSKNLAPLLYRIGSSQLHFQHRA